MTNKSLLFSAYNKARAATRHATGIEMKRLNRALSMIQSGHTEHIAKYHTTLRSCSCKDSQVNPHTICKHRLALMLSYRMGTIQANRSAQVWEM